MYVGTYPGIIPKQPQESVFQLRESCQISSITSAFVFSNTKALVIKEIWRFGALKNPILEVVWVYVYLVADRKRCEGDK
jgi:hypothetical protein